MRRPAQGLAPNLPGYSKFVSEPCEAGLYTYVWKTDESSAGQCGELQLGLADGSGHHALFRFVADGSGRAEKLSFMFERSVVRHAAPRAPRA